MTETHPIVHAIKNGIVLVFKNPAIVFSTVSLYLLSYLVPSLIQRHLLLNHPAVSFLAGFSGLVLQMTFFMALVHVSIKLVAEIPVVLSDLVMYIHRFYSCFLATLLYFFIVFLGLCLFIIPGVILAGRLIFIFPVLVEEKCGPLSALKRSVFITKGETIALIQFIMLTLAFNLAGALLFGIGLLFTFPATMIALSTLYVQLSKKEKGSFSQQRKYEKPQNPAFFHIAGSGI